MENVKTKVVESAKRPDADRKQRNIGPRERLRKQEPTANHAQKKEEYPLQLDCPPTL